MPRLKPKQTMTTIIPRTCAGSQTPRSPPPPLTPARPTVDSQLETGQDRRTRERGGGGPGGLRVGRPCCPSCKREREMQDARDSRRNKNTKHNPPPRPRTMGKPPGKRGKGTQPTQRKEEPATAGEGGKHGKGKPTHPEERKKAPLGQEEPKKEDNKIAGGATPC